MSLFVFAGNDQGLLGRNAGSSTDAAVVSGGPLFRQKGLHKRGSGYGGSGSGADPALGGTEDDNGAASAGAQASRVSQPCPPPRLM